MSRRAAYELFETLLAQALRSPEPARAIQRMCADIRLPLGFRKALAGVDADGVRLTAMLVAKLRFELLIQGSDEAAAWFERDAASFADMFRRYHHEVAPIAFFPAEEARLFLAWCEAQPK